MKCDILCPPGPPGSPVPGTEAGTESLSVSSEASSEKAEELAVESSVDSRDTSGLAMQTLTGAIDRVNHVVLYRWSRVLFGFEPRGAWGVGTDFEGGNHVRLHQHSRSGSAVGSQLDQREAACRSRRFAGEPA